MTVKQSHTSGHIVIYSPVSATCCVGIVGLDFKVIENNRNLLIRRGEEHERTVCVGWIVGRITW